MTFATGLVRFLVCEVGVKVPPRRALVVRAPPRPSPPRRVTLPARQTSALVVNFYDREYLSPEFLGSGGEWKGGMWECVSAGEGEKTASGC